GRDFCLRILMEATTLEITIQRFADNGWPAVMEWSGDGELALRREGDFAVDRDSLLATVERKTYGTLLGKGLFRDDLRSAFDLALAGAQGCLHVLLVLEDPELKSWHWERLCGPLDGDWKH